MSSLLRFTIETNLQEELDFVCQNVPPEIEFLKITVIGSGITFTRFTDIYRLRKLQTLKIHHIGPTSVDN